MFQLITKGIHTMVAMTMITAVTPAATANPDPIRIDAPELGELNFDLSTGGLKVAPGLETWFVFKSDREHPERADGLGWTYQHHPDMAVWHGRFYVGWNSSQLDEDTWPSRELISSSPDGKAWTKPVEMFPQGVSTPLRVYFYLAKNQRMLVIAGLRKDQNKTREWDKRTLVVRELGADHALGKVFTLKAPPNYAPNQPAAYKESSDPGFVEACGHLLADHLFLEQQDYGTLMEPEQRMKWNTPENFEGDADFKKSAADFGKAMSFFERKDGAIVGLSKLRWVTLSEDHGKNWSQPVRPASLVTGMGKVWGQRTPDGRYAMVYNPDLSKRWPLAMLTSDDGITFRDPVALHGDLPKRRYEGLHKAPGISYHRGLCKWNDDGSLKDGGMWMVASLNKEDICVMRIPMKK